ncbi:MAG: DUF4199 domain-containing protein [Prevotellaceae bacterium]|jgi:hypothetical protein|nr:DUF4199 domain-containing protein [Prevotellaceae bacterium]
MRELDLEEKKKPDFLRMASKFGLIMGLATSAVHFIFYLLEGSNVSSFIVTMLTLIAVIYIIYKATKNYRTESGGYISYRQALVYGVAIFMFAGIVGAIYSYIFNTIDPEYVYRQLETVKQQFLDAKFAEMAVEQIISDMREGLDYQMQHPFQSILSAIFWNTFLGTLFCLVSSAFLRKNKPEIINES